MREIAQWLSPARFSIRDQKRGKSNRTRRAAIAAGAVLYGVASASTLHAEESVRLSPGGYFDGTAGFGDMQASPTPGMEVQTNWLVGSPQSAENESHQIAVPPLSSYFDSRNSTNDGIPLAYSFDSGGLIANGLYQAEDEWSFGVNVDLHSGFSLSASYEKENPKGYSAVGSYDVGVSYGLGAWRFGVAYFNTVRERQPSVIAEELEAIEAGITYDLSSNMKASVNAIYAARETAESEGPTEGMAGVVGFSFQF